jgi:glycosyltransferase involved in cell wall biosynthesis
MMQELVSVIIPSCDRPQLLRRAIQSVVNQSLKSIEILVVLNGTNDGVKELEQLGIPELRVISLPTKVGPASARNTGVQQAKGEWVAFLDDDDEWLPQKLESQLALAKRSTCQFPVISSRFFAVTPKGKLIWPRRLPDPKEHLSDYLFARNSFFLGEGFIQTSTLFTKKALFDVIAFDDRCYRHEDWKWLLQVNALEDVEIQFVPEPVAYWYADVGRPRLSNSDDWQYSLDWIRSVQDLVTPKAYAGFLMTVVSYYAATAKNWKAFGILLWEAIRLGKLRPIDLFLYANIWFVPQDLRQQVRASMTQFFRPQIARAK